MKKHILLSFLILTVSVNAEDLILDGRVIPLNPSSKIRIDASGNIHATSNNGDLTCAQVGDPPTLSLSINPTSINAGDSATLNWTTGNNAVSCTKGGSWSGTISGASVSNGPHSITINNISANSTYTLQCSNTFGSSPERSVNLLVNTGNPNCAAFPPILNGNEDFAILVPPGGNLNTALPRATYDGLFSTAASGTDWPGVSGQQIFFSNHPNKYVAMKFTTNLTNASAILNNTTSGNLTGPPPDSLTMAISECPGDFTLHDDNPRCLRVGGVSIGIKWSQDPNANPLQFCKLEQGKTYYLNTVHSNSTANSYSTTSCTQPWCGNIFSQSTLN